MQFALKPMTKHGFEIVDRLFSGMRLFLITQAVKRYVLIKADAVSSTHLSSLNVIGFTLLLIYMDTAYSLSMDNAFILI